MKKIYFTPLIAEFAAGVEIGFCGSTVSAYVNFSSSSKYERYLEGEQ